jgi:predicted alpha/beta hydrolase
MTEAADPFAVPPCADPQHENAYYFGPPNAPLFGCLHAPMVGDGDTTAGQAVVLCNAFGSEELSAHRPWRDLARQLARHGHWVLRFDYRASGDSSGDSEDTELVTTWIASVDTAIDEIKRTSGRQQVVVVGLRLGAILGWQASTRRVDVLGWAGVAPTLSGRQYVRELNALQAAAGLADTMPAEQGLESGGFVMNAATRDAVAALDMRTPDHSAGRHALIVERPGRTVPSTLTQRLANLGVAVVSGVGSDLEDVFAEPHHCKTPKATWNDVVAWVDRLPATADCAPCSSPTAATAEWDGVIEQHEYIATRTGRLSAITSRGSGPAPSSGKAILFLNAGAIRRIGPGRFHVQLARELARQGHFAIRLDISGLGDSDPAPGSEDNIVYSPTAVDEVCDAVAAVLRRPEIRNCAVVGLCAGAYHGLRAAFSGANVRCVVAINPLTYYWEQGQTLEAAPRPHEVISEAARYRSIVFTLEPWLKLLRGEAHVRRMVQLLTRGAARHVIRWGRDMGRRVGVPLHHDLGRELAGAARRGVRVSFIFAEGEPGRPLLKDQAGSVATRLLRDGAMSLQTVPRADHVFLNLKPRRRLIELIHHALGTSPNGTAPNAVSAPVASGSRDSS